MGTEGENDAAVGNETRNAERGSEETDGVKQTRNNIVETIREQYRENQVQLLLLRTLIVPFHA